MTQIESAKKGIYTPEMKIIAEEENIPRDELIEKIASGKIVILKNANHDIKPIGIGSGLRTKVNANIGSSPERMNLNEELQKLSICEKYGTDTVMDLSLGAILNEIRKKILEKSHVPVGTVPIYQTGFELSRSKKKIQEMSIENFTDTLEGQAKDGVDFVTIHSGVTLKAWNFIKEGNRLLNVVSRGGAMLCLWMEYNKEENPLYSKFNRILDIARRYDVTISLGDGMRPGAISDASDNAQMEELITLGELARQAREAGVQVMIEGPGHVALDRVISNIQLEKSLCDGAPFYILGPLVTDIASGYDHIAGAIGSALAASAGADFLCYITPAEHLSLPNPDDVKQGVIASRIAAHAADIVKFGPKFKNIDREMSLARKNLDWEKMYALSIDPENARAKREKSGAQTKDYCTMCGEFCSVKAMKDIENLFG